MGAKRRRRLRDKPARATWECWRCARLNLLDNWECEFCGVLRPPPLERRPSAAPVVPASELAARPPGDEP
jgi:hypothetical protein